MARSSRTKGGATCQHRRSLLSHDENHQGKKSKVSVIHGPVTKTLPMLILRDFDTEKANLPCPKAGHKSQGVFVSLGPAKEY